ncbi:MAG: sensor histidine kinase [Streptosporangiaceae bacterium]
MSRSRSQPIRSAIVSLIAIPLVALVLLWAFAATESLGDGVGLTRARKVESQLVRPVQDLVDSLQKERRLAMAAAVGESAVNLPALKGAQGDTDRLGGVYNDQGRTLLAGSSPEVRASMKALSERLLGLPGLREDGVPRQTLFQGYNDLVDLAFAIYHSVSPKDPGIAREARNLTALGQSRELLSRSDALVANRLTRKRLPLADRLEFIKITGAQRYLYDSLIPQLRPEDKVKYDAFVQTVGFQRFDEMRDRLVAGRAVTQGDWDGNSFGVVHGLFQLENEVLGGVGERAQHTAIGVLLKLTLAGGLGLVAVVISLIIAWRTGRRLVRESRALAETVGSFTRDQLPELAAAIRRGERVADVPDDPRATFTVTEIERIFRSFTAARRAVLESATHEAATMKGVSEVFVNLASRNQALLHRQLTLLDRMERDAEDPAALADLFQLDHLATRMRRHAEGLVILSGKAPGRGWRSPVPLVDIIRGAASEVEDYSRVRVLPMPRRSLVGPAVADVIHLIADLVENAVQFSPPDAPIEVTGTYGPDGFVLEVQDRGLGLPQDSMDQINARLLDPPAFDLSDTARLGLFVVARLAKRHGIQVWLKASAHSGTTAVIMLPSALIAPEEPTEPIPAVRPAPARVATLVRSKARTEHVVRVEPEAGLHNGLPTRRRQTARQPVAAADPEPDTTERSPDDLRLRMAAMQQGWQRGRTDSIAQDTAQDTAQNKENP